MPQYLPQKCPHSQTSLGMVLIDHTHCLLVFNPGHSEERELQNTAGYVTSRGKLRPLNMGKILCGAERKLMFSTEGLWSPCIYFKTCLETEFHCSLSFKGRLLTAPQFKAWRVLAQL